MDLKRLEAGVRSLIESQLLKAVPGQKPEDRVARQLIQALGSGIQTDSQGNRVAPNVFTLLIHPDSVRYWRDPLLLQWMIDILVEEAQASGARLSASPSIGLSPDAGISLGEFRVVASHEVVAIGETQDILGSTPTITQGEETADLPENAFLIVGGAEQFELTRPVINIGRRLDNDVVIEDPRVSRHHVQMRAIKGRFVLFDLNSSGGTYINGQRKSQSVLEPGDVVSLAGVSLVYGQDASTPRPATDGTAPRAPADGGRSNGVAPPAPTSHETPA